MAHSTRSSLRRHAFPLLLVAVLTTGVAVCTATDPLATDMAEGGSSFTSGQFTSTEISPADRGAPVSFSATTDEGEAVTSDDLVGDVAVVNFWYAACGPCRAEATELEEAHLALEAEGVTFLGINTEDQAATAKSFAATYGVTYSSVLAVNEPDVKLAFVAVAPLQATPTTLVLDRQGRVAARILGTLESASTLEALVNDVLAETEAG